MANGTTPRDTSAVLYFTFKTLHALGVVILLGNVTATPMWKVFADRTGDAKVVAFAQRLVTIADWGLMVRGIVMVIGGGRDVGHDRQACVALPYVSEAQRSTVHLILMEQ